MSAHCLVRYTVLHCSSNSSSELSSASMLTLRLGGVGLDLGIAPVETLLAVEKQALALWPSLSQLVHLCELGSLHSGAEWPVAAHFQHFPSMLAGIFLCGLGLPFVLELRLLGWGRLICPALCGSSPIIDRSYVSASVSTVIQVGFLYLLMSFLSSSLLQCIVAISVMRCSWLTSCRSHSSDASFKRAK